MVMKYKYEIETTIIFYVSSKIIISKTPGHFLNKNNEKISKEHF
jgi:hypothetical protein